MNWHSHSHVLGYEYFFYCGLVKSLCDGRSLLDSVCWQYSCVPQWNRWAWPMSTLFVHRIFRSHRTHKTKKVKWFKWFWTFYLKFIFFTLLLFVSSISSYARAVILSTMEFAMTYFLCFFYLSHFVSPYKRVKCIEYNVHKDKLCKSTCYSQWVSIHSICDSDSLISTFIFFKIITQYELERMNSPKHVRLVTN